MFRWNISNSLCPYIVSCNVVVVQWMAVLHKTNLKYERISSKVTSSVSALIISKLYDRCRLLSCWPVISFWTLDVIDYIQIRNVTQKGHFCSQEQEHFHISSWRPAVLYVLSSGAVVVSERCVVLTACVRRAIWMRCGARREPWRRERKDFQWVCERSWPHVSQTPASFFITIKCLLTYSIIWKCEAHICLCKILAHVSQGSFGKLTACASFSGINISAK